MPEADELDRPRVKLSPAEQAALEREKRALLADAREAGDAARSRRPVEARTVGAGDEPEAKPIGSIRERLQRERDAEVPPLPADAGPVSDYDRLLKLAARVKQAEADFKAARAELNDFLAHSFLQPTGV